MNCGSPVVPTGDPTDRLNFHPHKVSWSDFDELARGYAAPEVVRRLRRAEHSRRKLLLRALDDKLTKEPQLLGPLPSPDHAWELFERVEKTSPRALDLVLAHPYTGAWVGYVTRLLHNQITGTCPLWLHLGHLHALAAAAAIQAGIRFETRIPVWDGGAMLPTLGMVRLSADPPHSVAHVHGDKDFVEIHDDTTRVRLPRKHSEDLPNWWPLRGTSTRAGGLRLSVWLDDLEPYRGLYEPKPAKRLNATEVARWRRMLDEAWQMVVRVVPDLAPGFGPGLDSLVPSPAIPFRTLSASTEEAFASAIVARPADSATLAAALVHEFHHILLGGLLHLIPMHLDDTRERFYTLWRDDPRHISGVLQGVYAFFGVAEFWRGMSQVDTRPADRRRAQFEFAYWRYGAWRTLRSLSGDASLTPAGQRFVDGIAERLEPWQEEPLPTNILTLSACAARDHSASWRIRHIRPDEETVADFAGAWLAGHQWPTRMELDPDPPPTPVPDGSSSSARTDLLRIGLTTPEPHQLREVWPTVPGATAADFAYVSGRPREAIDGYRAQLTRDWDDVDSWIGLGLALSANGGDTAGARALLYRPELVRAVHRQIHARTGLRARPDELALWIGRAVC